MSKHTPGPWAFRKDECWTIFADGESIMGDAAYYPWVPEREADWRLIAAAPELLEALQRIITASDSDAASGGEMWYAEAVYPAVEAARAAIAKATGEGSD